VYFFLRPASDFRANPPKGGDAKPPV